MRTLELCVVCVSVLVSCTSLVSCMRPPGCSRKPPTGVDCSTVDGECQTLYNNTAPYALIGQIPYPSPKYVQLSKSSHVRNYYECFVFLVLALATEPASTKIRARLLQRWSMSRRYDWRKAVTADTVSRESILLLTDTAIIPRAQYAGTNTTLVYVMLQFV